MKCFWAPFLHFYQPPIQDTRVLKEINATCYEPLFNMLLSNPDFKITINFNTVLIDLLLDHGIEQTVNSLKELVSNQQIEIVGTAKFHPILPLIPKKEVIRQISLQEADLSTYFPGWGKKGFFAPEMAVSPGLVSLLSKLNYEWILSSGIACSSEWSYDKIYQSPEGVRLFFRDDVLSNEISFKKISVEFFLDKLKIMYDVPHYIITAQDGETFGHHFPKYESKFLEPALNGALEDEDIELCWISDLIKKFETDGKIKLISSSWSTNQGDLDYNTSFPLWNHPDNPVHRIQYKFLKNVFELVYLLENNAENEEGSKTARYFLDRGLHSCQFWWGSTRPMWSPNLIMKGAELLLRAAFNARIGIIDGLQDKQILAESEELFDQITQYYSLLLMEITRMEQTISGKKGFSNLVFENIFLDEKDIVEDD
ncbi:MAG: hypothetical protein ACFFCS_06890 [Candidatus Hodarchaeota archaeon]